MPLPDDVDLSTFVVSDENVMEVVRHRLKTERLVPDVSTTGNIMSFKESGYDYDYTDVDLPGGSVIRNLVGSMDGVEKNGVLKSMTRSVNNYGILSLFAERGGWSKQLYQGKLNHRTLDYASFTTHKIRQSGNGTNVPLAHSLFSKEEAYHFDMTTPISLFAYEVDRTITHGGVEINSQGTLSLPSDVSSDVAGNMNCRGTMSDRSMKLLSANCFMRMLSLFGIKMKEKFGTGAKCLKDTSKLLPIHLVTFLDVFKGCHLGSENGLKELVEKFNMDRFFTCDDKLTWEENFDLLGVVCRSLTNFRIGAHEGQHRFGVVTLALSGYWSVSNRAPLIPEKLSESPFRSFSSEFGEMQCWSNTKITLTLSESENVAEVVQKLHQFGSARTAAADISVYRTWDHLVLDFLHMYEHSEGVESGIVPVDFQSYWAAQINEKCERFKRNDAIAFAIVKELMKDPSVEGVSHGSVRGSPEAMKKTLENTFCGKIPLKAFATTSNLTGVSMTAEKMLWMIKLIYLSKDDRNTMRGFLTLTGSEKRQREGGSQLMQTQCRSLKWIGECIMNPLTLVMNHMEAKLTVEFFLLRLLECATLSKGTIDSWKAAMNDSHWALNGVKEVVDKIAEKNYDLSTRKNLKKRLSVSNNTFYKFIFASWNHMFTDILETFIKCGCDPAIPVFRGSDKVGLGYLVDDKGRLEAGLDSAGVPVDIADARYTECALFELHFYLNGCSCYPAGKVPVWGATKSKSGPKLSMEILLSLHFERLDALVNKAWNEKELFLLKGFEPVVGTERVRLPNSFGIWFKQDREGFNDALMNRMTSLKSFVKPDILFSDFVNNIMNGTCVLKKNHPKFIEMVRKHMTKAKDIYKSDKLTKTSDEEGSLGALSENDDIVEDNEGVVPDFDIGKRLLSEPHRNEGVFGDAKNVFRYLWETDGLLKSVTLDDSKLEEELYKVEGGYHQPRGMKRAQRVCQFIADKKAELKGMKKDQDKAVNAEFNVEGEKQPESFNDDDWIQFGIGLLAKECKFNEGRHADESRQNGLELETLTERAKQILKDMWGQSTYLLKVIEEKDEELQLDELETAFEKSNLHDIPADDTCVIETLVDFLQNKGKVLLEGKKVKLLTSSDAGFVEGAMDVTSDPIDVDMDDSAWQSFLKIALRDLSSLISCQTDDVLTIPLDYIVESVTDTDVRQLVRQVLEEWKQTHYEVKDDNVVFFSISDMNRCCKIADDLPWLIETELHDKDIRVFKEMVKERRNGWDESHEKAKGDAKVVLSTMVAMREDQMGRVVDFNCQYFLENNAVLSSVKSANSSIESRRFSLACCLLKKIGSIKWAAGKMSLTENFKTQKETEDAIDEFEDLLVADHVCDDKELDLMFKLLQCHWTTEMHRNNLRYCFGSDSTDINKAIPMKNEKLNAHVAAMVRHNSLNEFKSLCTHKSGQCSLDEEIWKDGKIVTSRSVCGKRKGADFESPIAKRIRNK